MKLLIRYFFRAVRLILTPIVLAAEALTTPKPLPRSAEEQAKLEQASHSLALYQFKACPFCIRVRKQLTRLGLPVEQRDAKNNPQYRSELESRGGRVKVPCLKIQHEDGKEEWLYESSKINAWLTERFEKVATAQEASKQP